MKNKSKQLKQGPTERNINLDLNWEKLADMEASLRKIINSPVSLPFSHESIQLLLKFTKQILKAIETMKSQQKHFREIQQSYNMIQSKLSNHENIVNNLEQQHMQRYKSLSDEIKNSKEYYEKAKKNLQQSEQQSKLQYQAMKKENQQMKYKMDMLTKQKYSLILQLKSKELQVKALQQHKQRFVKVTTLFAESQPKYNQPNLASILCSSIAHRITAYLSPLDITNLQLINKQCRIYLKKSKSVQNSLNKSIIQTKNRTIAYYHKHIDYFEKLYHKIPQQILQTTFYRYQILKQSIGTQILNVLNSSAMLFEGKFQDIDDDQMKEKREDEHQGTKSKGTSIAGLNIDIQKQIKNLKEFNNENPSNVLEIDEDIIRQFLQDHKSSREKLTKQISSMYSKIKTTAQIYSVDVQSIGKFITNILINFSKVFVLSKNLYAEARNLQSLNTLILRQLANWDKIQVQKNSQIEDLKAQLQAQRKLKIFFTNQSIKSQQRALAQENVKLSMEYKFSKQVEKLDSIFRQKQQLKANLAECQNNLNNLKSDNREIRRAYQSGKQKYNKILEQLSVVKETILRMNIV